MPNHDNINGGQKTHFISVSAKFEFRIHIIWGHDFRKTKSIYFWLKKLGKKDPITMKLKTDVLYHLPYVFTKF